MLSDLQSTGKGKKAFPRERDSKKIDPDIRVSNFNIRN